MKTQPILVLLLGAISLFLIGCAIVVESPSPEPTNQPPIDAPTLAVNPASTITLVPTASDPPQPSATTTNPYRETMPAVTLTLPPATIMGVPQSTTLPPTEEATPTTIAPAVTTTARANTPLITFFQANVAESDPGETITLEWGTNRAITVTLWRLAPTGQFSHFWSVPERGTFEYQIGTNERNRTTFFLSAIDGLGNNEMITAGVTLRCPDKWFFEDPPDICPATAAIFSPGAEQQFERGTMIWIAAENRLYVLFDDGQQYAWQAYNDDWQSGEADRDPNLTPPRGFYQPVRGFGLVWREQPSVRDRLGWATTEEIAYQSAIQRTSFAKYNEIYIQSLDGFLWRLLAERSGWEKIPTG